MTVPLRLARKNDEQKLTDWSDPSIPLLQVRLHTRRPACRCPGVERDMPRAALRKYQTSHVVRAENIRRRTSIRINGSDRVLQPLALI